MKYNNKDLLEIFFINYFKFFDNKFIIKLITIKAKYQYQNLILIL